MFPKHFKTTFRVKRFFSAQPRKESIQSFRSQECNPANHTANHSAQFYEIKRDVCKTLFNYGGLPKAFTIQTKTFTETCVMVREPALEIIDLIKQSDLSKPANKFVMYGENGAGKSLVLAHLIHFAYMNDFLLVHVPWVPEFLRRTGLFKEVTNSTTREGMIDIPLDAAEWLVHFKAQNFNKIKELNLTVSNEYIWSKREKTASGSPLIELIELGINRVKYASDIVVALLEEIKILSTNNICKTFVAIDGYSSFFYPLTRLRTSAKKKISPGEVTLTHAFLQITKSDWCNGVIVVVADQLAVGGDHRESYFPRYLLGKNGFEHLDPFIPIEVKKYSEKEFLSCMSYYRDRMWIRGHPDAETELAFTSANNPYRLMELCAPL